MKAHIPFLLAGLFTLGANASAQSLTEVAQLQLGRLLPSDSIRVYMEYPELEALGENDIKSLKQAGFKPTYHVQLHVNFGVSRGNTVADVSFVPVVKRGGRWYRVVNYELKTENIGKKLSPAFRTVLETQRKLDATERYADNSVLSQGKWVKIRVKKEGLYQLSYSQLQKMGFADPSRVKLYGYGGRLLPEKFTFTGDDALIDDLNEVPLYRRDGSVVFFAEGLTRWLPNRKFQTNTFSNYSYYFLTEGDEPAKLETLEAPSGQGHDVSEVPAHALLDNDAFVWYGGGRDFYDSHDLQGGHTFKLSLPGNVGGKQPVTYDVSAKSATVATKVWVNQGNSSESVARNNIQRVGEGESARGYRGSFLANLGEEEKFTITTSNSGRLNYIYAEYTQTLTTVNTKAAFTPGKSGAVDLFVGEANENTRVLQLGNSRTPACFLSGNLDEGIYAAKAADGRQRFVIVDIAKEYDSPEVVGEVANQNLHADAALDYIIIVPASGKLTEQAERLAEAHRNKGLRVKVVPADQIYNEFSSGTPDATAYRRYLKMLYDRAATEQDAPKYLLLFGDCVYDNRMVTPEFKGGNPDDYLLAYERNDQESFFNSEYSIGTLHSYVTDDYYGFLDDNEGERITTDKLDLGIGRYLCHTEEDAKWLVDQSLTYMENKNAGSWKNKMWAIADVGDENLHMNDAQAVAAQVAKSANSSFLLQRIYPDTYTVTQEAKGATYPEATQKLKTAMKQGALIFNYNGHGSPDRLSHHFLLSKEEMLGNTSDALPLWLYASCEITPYDQVIKDLGRNALYNRTGPAVAVLCAARSVYANYNRSLNMGFVEFAFGKDKNGKRYTMGDALRLTKCELIKNTADHIGVDQTINKLKYALLGDPAIALSYPDPGIVVDSVNGVSVTQSSFNEVPVGGIVRFSGYVNSDLSAAKPDTAFNGKLTGTVFTPIQTITCKGFGNRYTDPLVYKDYTQTLFEGSVKVKNGRFTLEFMVPRGITFSKEKALLSLYALKDDATQEYNGQYKQFCFNGSASTEQVDSLGPSLYMYMNTPDFPNGGVVGKDATLYVSVADSSGISMVSGNLGHDMEMWLDNDPATTFVMNDYFSFDYGSYQKGLVECPLPSLSTGRHRLTFRAWDVFDNSSVTSLDFIVNEGGAPDFDVIATTPSPETSTKFITTFVANAEAESEVTTEVYNVTGMRVWHSSCKVPSGDRYATFDWDLTDYGGNKLDKGVYLYRSIVGKSETKTKKMVIR